MSIKENLEKIKKTIPEDVTLVAVSKTKPTEAILEAYHSGHRIFGENKIQEMAEKHAALPKDILWHMIGHVQRNKVKYMAPFVNLIHGVDSYKLLQEINKQAKKNNRAINCLLQIKIAAEDTKFGLNSTEALQILQHDTFKTLNNIQVVGVMGMATFTNNTTQVTQEFKTLKTVFNQLKQVHADLNIISMGMSGDYELAIQCGSNMIRVGSSIFGARN
ncbi:YggS family pyridoxal phosphate-dependent enzyme [Bizionia sediminis]|uniref:Pyridoxal phosphate homeostasis protein n=1 Tax=Bizionia sediminis TaxID=1737064 RepID=A0ABW5KU46_9FLAO